MPDSSPSPQLLIALGRLMRGLTALFWGLPAALILGVNVGLKTHFELRAWDAFLPLAATGLLYYGVGLLGAFHPQEGIWARAVDRSRALAMVLVGFSPFLYWRVRLPEEPAYLAGCWFLALFGLLFLFHLNYLLQRLVAMLPDAALRQEVMTFATLNQYLLAAIPLLLAAGKALHLLINSRGTLPAVARFMQQTGHGQDWFFLLLVLLPVAMTMAMVWKVKELVFHTLISARD